MTAKELWESFIYEKQIDDREYDAWSFGVEPDMLAKLAASGQKTGTSSAYILYELDGDPLPKIDEYSVILDSKHEAVCIIKNINVEIIPFDEITEEHAYKEGEGDKTLAYWRSVHEAFFRKCFAEAGIEFTYDTKVVYEEFAVVYSK